jgi:putative ABC transport system ATP-binding protein
MSPPYLQLQQVSRIFGDGRASVNALNNISFSLNSGEQIALVGPSGSGKSTLLNLIGVLDRPSAGTVRIDGQLVSSFDEAQASEFRRHRIGFIFQDDALVTELTLEENIELPLVLIGIGRAERKKRVAELLAWFGLSARAKTFPALLSGGEKQRGAVGRAVIHRPQMLLADEPTTNLDSDNATIVIDGIQQMAKQHGMTVLVSSHDQRVFEKFSRQLRLGDGRLCEPLN